MSPQGGIRFNESVFEEPVCLSAWSAGGCAGILAVVAADPAWSPRPFRPLYFGAFDGDTRGLEVSAPYLVAALPMPSSTAAQRRDLCDQLVAAYNPILQFSESLLQCFTPRPEARSDVAGLVTAAARVTKSVATRVDATR
jgi:hypothetical protein